MIFTELETQVVKALLAGNHPILENLRIQFENSVPARRKYTGKGFFTDFQLINSLEPKFKSNFHLGDVMVRLKGLKYETDYVLFVEDGKLMFLEGFAIDEPWPLIEQIETLQYVGGNERDWEKIYTLLDSLV